MRAMVLTQQKRVEELPLTLQQIDAPRAGASEVRVKVSVCAVCRTDLHIIEGDLAPHRMPAPEARGACFSVTSRLLRNRSGNWRDILEHEVVAGFHDFGLVRSLCVCRERNNSDKSDQRQDSFHNYSSKSRLKQRNELHMYVCEL